MTLHQINQSLVYTKEKFQEFKELRKKLFEQIYIYKQPEIFVKYFLKISPLIKSNIRYKKIKVSMYKFKYNGNISYVYISILTFTLFPP